MAETRSEARQLEYVHELLADLHFHVFFGNFAGIHVKKKKKNLQKLKGSEGQRYGHLQGVLGETAHNRSNNKFFIFKLSERLLRFCLSQEHTRPLKDSVMLENVDACKINLWLEEEVDSIITAMLINQLALPPSASPMSACFLSLASVSVGSYVAID